MSLYERRFQGYPTRGKVSETQKLIDALPKTRGLNIVRDNSPEWSQITSELFDTKEAATNYMNMRLRSDYAGRLANQGPQAELPRYRVRKHVHRQGITTMPDDRGVSRRLTEFYTVEKDRSI